MLECKGCGRTVLNPDARFCCYCRCSTLLPSPPEAAEKATGCELIAAERQRQIEKEGWTSEHDGQHDNMELATAASCYLDDAIVPRDWSDHDLLSAPIRWPWDVADWKSTKGDTLRQLVKAGALIAAEVDRIQSEGGQE